MILTSVQIAAETIGVSKQTIYRWLRAGHLRRYKNKPDAPRGTFVDMKQVRKLQEHPPLRER